MVPGSDEVAGWRVRLSALVALGIGTLAAGMMLELVARWRPLTRIQVVELAPLNAEVVDGIPIWHPAVSTTERMGRPCGDTPEVVLVGSSIFWGSGVADEDSPRVQLAQRLSDACVTLLGQPAYNFSNQRVEVARHLKSNTPRVVVWEMWRNSPRRWTVLDDTAYNLGFDAVGEADMPSPLGLGPAANLRLFGWSAAYRHVVVSLLEARGAALPALSARFATDVVQPELEAMIARGISVVLAYMPALDRPFEVSAQSRPTLYQMVHAQTGESVASVWVAEEMAARGVDVEAARFDTCCHYSAAGSRVLADILAERVQPLLDGGEPGGGP